MGVHEQAEFGVGFGGTLAPASYVGLSQKLEEYGFHVATVFGDLMMQPPVLPLATMAASTSKLRLGVGCFTPWTMHPAEIAGQIAYLDHLSNGRAFYGLVRGAWLDQLRIDTKLSLSAVKDTVAIVRGLLRSSEESYDGRVYGIAEKTTPFYPVLREDLPLMIGTWSPKLAAFAGSEADEVQVGGCANADMVPVIRDYVRVGELDSGRVPGSVGIVLTAATVVDEDGEAARARARTEVALPFHVIASLDSTVDVDPELLARMKPLLHDHRMEEAGRLIPDHLLDKFTFSGTPAQVTEQALKVYGAGAKRIEFDSPFGLTPDRGLELLGTQVLPALRAEGIAAG
jgi:5,10-methylenetetrahydromethanopterin reductase